MYSKTKLFVTFQKMKKNKCPPLQNEKGLHPYKRVLSAGCECELSIDFFKRLHFYALE